MDDVGEVVSCEPLLHLRPHSVDTGEDPALLEVARPGLGRDAGRVLEDQARDVPELVRQAPTFVDRLVRHARVLLGGHLREAVARRVGPVLGNHLERVDTGAERFRHAPAVCREHRRVDDHVAERDFLRELDPGEDHPVLPESDDLAGGDVEVAGVEAAEVGRVVRPAEGGERPDGGGEPGVEHVRVARELGRAALRAGVGLGLRDGRMTIRAVPGRDLVAPPNLPRDVPVGRVLE